MQKSPRFKLSRSLFWLSAFALFGAFTQNSHAQLGNTTLVIHSDMAPVIDGTADAVWDAVDWNEIGYTVGDPFATPTEEFAGQFKVLYDSAKLYVLVDVNDDVLGTYTEGGNAWRDDTIEFFFDLGEPGGEYDENTYQIYFRSETDAEFYWGANTIPVEGVTVERAHSLTDDGYLVEFALTWAQFGVDPADMMAFTMDINVNDADINEGGFPPARILWNNDLNDSSASAANFGTALLYEAQTAKAAMVAAGITVDGTTEEGWSSASWNDVGILLSAPWDQPATPFSARYKMTWDADNLYVLVDVVDDVLATYTEGGAAWRDDALEVFMDFGEPGGIYDENTYQIYFRSETDSEFYWGANSPQVEGATVPRAHTLTPDGYQIEFSISWSDFGVDPMELGSFGFDLNVNDGDTNSGGFPPARLVWNNVLNDSSASAENFGTVILSETPDKSAHAYMIAGGVAIDGAIDQGWGGIPWNAIDYLMPDWDVPESEFSAQYKVAYDSTNLYLLIDVVDDVLATYTEGGAAWRDDSIELFFDFAADGGIYDDQTYQVYFRSETDGIFIWGANSTTVEEPTFNRAHMLTSAGYVVEFSMALADYGIDPATLDKIGFDINVNDGDTNAGGFPPARLIWNNTVNDSSASAERFGTVVFQDEILSRQTAQALEDPRGIVVDGTMEDNWASAPWMEIGYLAPAPWDQESTDFSARFKVIYDQARLYLLVDVTDDVLATYTEGGQAWRDDAIELFFDVGEPGGAYDEQTFQVYFRSETDGEFYWGASSATVENPHLMRAHTLTDSGYMVEFSMAWVDFGVDPTALETLRFDINVNDGDTNAGGFPPARLIWNNTLNDSSNSAQNFGQVTMIPRKMAYAPELREPVVVDGTVDTVWGDVPANAFGDPLGAPWADPGSDFEASYQIAYDADNLYVLVNVVDDILATYTDGGRAWRDDSIEFFFDFGEIGGAYDENTYQIYFRSETDGEFYWGANSAQVEGATVPRAHTVTDNGYIVEFSLAWADFGVTPDDLGWFTLDFNVNDADPNAGGFPPARVLWNNILNNSSNTSDFFGVAQLVPLKTAVVAAVDGITVDGEAEAAWDTASWNELEYQAPLGFYQSLMPFGARFKAAYTADNLYFMVDVEDDILATYTDGGRAWRDDSLEVFIDFEADGGAYDEQTYQIYFRSETDSAFYWGASSAQAEGATVTRAHSVTDSGYMVEFSLAWADFGIDPASLSQIGFDLNVNDADPNEGGWPPARVIWNNAINNSSNSSTQFGFLQLQSPGLSEFSILVGASDAGDGELSSPWFGMYRESSDDWILHAEAGWLYVGFVASADGMWLWSHRLQTWLWSSESEFPVYYQFPDGRWITYFVLEDGSGYLFDFTNRLWVQLP